MANLKEVKARITSVTSTQQITKAMKMVAAAKLRKAQDRILQMRPFSRKLTGIMQNVASSVDTDTIENPYAEVRDVNKVLLIVVSSDRGLCGAFNSNIFKYTRALIESEFKDIHDRGDLTIMPIGKRSNDYFSKRGYDVINDYFHLMHELDFDHAMDAAKHVMDDFVAEKYDRVHIIYNEFKNVATQVLQLEQFLPISPQTGEEGTEVESSAYGADIDYIYEPSQEFIFKEIIPKSLKIQFYKCLLESNAAEHGARMTAMDQATDNAAELLKELKLTYNRTRQAAITKEILEIVGGAEALAKGG